MAEPLRRLAILTDGDPDSMSGEHVERLIAGRVREDTDLDYKATLYGNGDSEKRALAGDVAAMANTVGGVLVLGIAEEDGAAVDAPGVRLSEDEELRMRQIIATNTAPRVGATIHRVERAEGEGFYLIEVPKSTQAPHAVRQGEALRYLRRDGPRTRSLFENEVADAYRSRFEAAQSQVDQLVRTRGEGMATLSDGWSDRAWLTVSVVPNTPGQMDFRHGTPADVAREVRNRRYPLEDGAHRIGGGVLNHSAGLRRVVLVGGQDYESREIHGSCWHLHTGGAGFAAVPIGWEMRDNRGEVVEPFRLVIDDEELVIAAAQMLDALSHHAVDRCRVASDAIIRASVEHTVALPAVGTHLAPVVLGHFRDGGMGVYEIERQVPRNSVPHSDHTIDLTAVAASPHELLAATRMVVTDIMQGLGRPECWQVSAEGELRIRYFRRGRQRQISEWADGVGIEVTEETIT